MNKYKLINKKTGEEHLCDKVIIDEFDEYWEQSQKEKGGTFKRRIATNNPNIDLPKVVDEVKDLAKVDAIGIFGNDFSLASLAHQIEFERVYNKSQETHPFSVEDMIAFANWLFLWQQNSIGEWKHQNKNQVFKTTQELLQLWQSQQPKVIYYETI